MPAALYARVSTVDKDQDPDTQLLFMRRYCNAHNIAVYKEYVDKASAKDLRRRKSWRQLLDDAVRNRFDTVLCWKLDRMFRSVKHMHDSLEVFENLEIRMISTSQDINTDSAMGRLMLNMLALLAEFETDQLSERVRASQEARKEKGLPYARPRVEDLDPGLTGKLEEMYRKLAGSEETISSAAKQLGISRSVMSRRYKQHRQNEEKND